TLEINSIGTPSARENYRKALVEYFRARQDQLDHDSQRRLERNPIRILDSKNPSMQVLLGEAPLLADYLDAESCTHFEEVKSLLSGVGVDFTENPRLVRGLDYYNRTVFEWVSNQLGAQSAVCSGGRYDGLISHLGGKDTPAVGWALGVERVVELLRVEGSDVPRRSPDAYLAIIGDIGRTQGFVLGESLRDSVSGLYLLVDAIGGSLKSQLRRADRSGAKWALILGNDEQKGDHISVKSLRDDRPQLVLTLDELIKHLRNGVD
ncbi:MAG: histidine--tRNA ligase, partial [Dehalococcoidia bacterium]|nr:histidine--tRNA ligase [Dehalococcoidia bacterium]